MSIVSNNIKYLRRLNGLTQEQFSRRIGIKRSLLGAYEEARANPNLENLKTIAQVFGTSVDSLIKTDIRKIRETPGISLGQSTTGIMEQVKVPVNDTVGTFQKKEVEAQPIAKIIDEYFQEKEEDKQPIRTEKQFVPNRLNYNISEKTFQSFTDNQYTNNNKPLSESPQKSFEIRIPYVKRSQIKDYLANYTKSEYIKTLATFSLPFVSSEKSRAFEMGSDFPLQNSVVIGNAIEHWTNILDGKFYILITPQQGIIYRRVYNQIKVKGTLLLSSDDSSIPSFEISLKSIAEIWEVSAFISKELPEPRISLERAKSLIEELSLELNQLK
ncbi:MULTISPECIES: helix-turn-helix transcriptional regulator [unclassified Arcicella]|uniref:helix-turn-helix domain-containing protein n=1 Tax=unclassified Arcicella TaxID=2644986 RepID=UPI0028559113|nr:MULTISPECIES: helix-turn-helix transcriptional regulator [unclassified Arcicella]MDR6561636.1 transcriptional regulator with XRE-family HTH domain [Arcicella sp. BE51]MDR6812416.1 transcriptional regulator with XRE-family HTH domain [Arcicella sp. BE140]MDR6823812.1 transcriptional regulator with XRE-family HTH domain [Arcicella sp. BE139]